MIHGYHINYLKYTNNIPHFFRYFLFKYDQQSNCFVWQTFRYRPIHFKTLFFSYNLNFNCIMKARLYSKTCNAEIFISNIPLASPGWYHIIVFFFCNECYTVHIKVPTMVSYFFMKIHLIKRRNNIPNISRMNFKFDAAIYS